MDEESLLLGGERIVSDETCFWWRNEKLTIFGRRVNKDTYVTFWKYVWLFAAAFFGSFFEFWLPDWIIFGQINITNYLKNAFGAFLAGMVTSLEQVKFHKPQTYFLYESITGSLCSVITTFGNVIEDAQNQIEASKWGCPSILFGNLIASFILRKLGKFVAKKINKDVNFSQKMKKLDDEDNRMLFEFSVAQENETQHNIGKSEYSVNTPRKVNYLQNDISFSPSENRKIFTNKLDTPLLKPKTKQQTHKLTKTFSIFIKTEPKKAKKIKKIVGVKPFQKHIKKKAIQKFQNSSLKLELYHKIILVLCFTLPIINIPLVRISRYFPTDVDKSNKKLEFYYYIMFFWNVVGVFAGRFISGSSLKWNVQWGTFRVNMVSCIFIAFAHNLLKFGGYISQSFRFIMTVKYFISDFCGSESGWAILIEETGTLYEAPIPKKIAIINLTMNFFFSFIVYMLLVWVVQIIFFFQSLC
ncbi:fluoride export protein 1-related [Anaeramoeba flamelloides]|uniref:Fluoride export protein 1-related n=1 Tax=Anaeramoeba flamelloides TaxID=1746091 RepID=A0AAV8AJW3_9EUKA|nr:fluoride export protein 1-related [Anaeramoeba flamelloides]